MFYFFFFQALLEPLFLTPVDDPILRITNKPFVNITDIDDFNINIPSVSKTVLTENIRQDRGLDESEDFLLLTDIFDKPITDSGNSIQKEPSLVKYLVLEEEKETQSTDSEVPIPIVIQEVEIEPDDDFESVQKITGSGETIEIKVEEEKETNFTDTEDPTPIVLVEEVEIEPDNDFEKCVQKITDSEEATEVEEQEAEYLEYLPINIENGLQIIDSRSLVQEDCDINEYLLKNQGINTEIIEEEIVIQSEREERQITDSESGQPNLNSLICTENMPFDIFIERQIFCT